MSEYIDKSSLYDRVFDRFEGEDLISKAEVLQMIAAAPLPAADVEKVVRCKDCEHYVANYCTRDIKGRTNMFYMNENDFCSYGEKKEGVK